MTHSALDWTRVELWHPSALCSLPGCWPDMSRVRLHVIRSVPHSWQRDLAPSLLLNFDFPALLCFVDPELPVRSGLRMHPNIIRLFSNIAISCVQSLSPMYVLLLAKYQSGLNLIISKKEMCFHSNHFLWQIPSITHFLKIKTKPTVIKCLGWAKWLHLQMGPFFLRDNISCQLCNFRLRDKLPIVVWNFRDIARTNRGRKKETRCILPPWCHTNMFERHRVPIVNI